jgi:hypothetical protein
MSYRRLHEQLTIRVVTRGTTSPTRLDAAVGHGQILHGSYNPFFKIYMHPLIDAKATAMPMGYLDWYVTERLLGRRRTYFDVFMQLVRVNPE